MSVLPPDPPAEVRKATSIKDRQSRIRGMYGRHVERSLEQAKDIGLELKALKEQCIQERKDWLPELSQCEIAARTAQRYMQIADNWPLLSSHLRTVAQMTMAEAIKWASENYCRSCALNGPKKSCKDCKAKRGGPRDEPGLDEPEEYEKQIASANKFWRPRLEALAKLKADPKKLADQAFRCLEGLLTAYKQLHEAQMNPAEPPRKAKCKDCKADILWAGPNEKGKNVPLEPIPGGGQFELVDNRPVFRKWELNLDTSGLYRRHDCPARKK